MRGLGNGQPTTTAPPSPWLAGPWYQPGHITPPSPVEPTTPSGPGPGPVVPPVYPAPPYMGPPPGPFPMPQPQPLPNPVPPGHPEPGPAPQLPWMGGGSQLEPSTPSTPGSDFAAVLRQNVVPVLVVGTALVLVGGAVGYYYAKHGKRR